MEAMRVAWTDERLDDLNAKVDRIDKRVDGLRAEMNARFESLQKTMITMFATTMSTMIVGFVSLLAAIFTQV
jgi:hypothetical protein